jgi:hypothetical protein
VHRLVAALLALTMSGASTAHLRVVVDVGLQTGPTHTEQATLRCDNDHTRATGFLRGRSKAACQIIRRGVLRRVVHDQQSRRLCSQIYSGPQRARITGTVGGDGINLTITRTDGCGTTDWDRLVTLLGRPERSTARCPAAHHLRTPGRGYEAEAICGSFHRQSS